MTRTFCATAALCVLATALFATIPDPVRTDAGQLSGVTLPSGVRVFRGIPFGAPPLGDLRWRPAQPVAKWDGVRKADTFGNVCTQPKGRGRLNVSVDLPDSPAASEDCLYLNVWTAAASASERRPVMVWIFGGAYTEGAGSSPHNDGEALARKGVVAVSVNYRLGPFGFFSHPELTKESGKNASGNQAMSDNIAALRWVQKNIAAFGGDPNNVTIFGESAGAALVAGLTGSPEAKGLFHRAISESGAWMGLSMATMRPRASAEEPAPGRGGAPAPPLPSLAELRKKSTDEISASLRGAGMIIDGWIVPEDLSITFAQGRQNAVDVLVGANKDEGSFTDGLGPGVTAAQWTAQVKQRWGRSRRSVLERVPGNHRPGSEPLIAAPLRGRDVVAHAALRDRSGEEGQEGVALLLHARTASRSRSTQSACDAHRGDSVRLQQSQGAARVSGRELAHARVSIAKGSRACGNGLLVLGELRAQRRSERQRASRRGPHSATRPTDAR
jgi:para-nitrobenzyl esterase